MYNIKIEYRTGDSFGSEDMTEEIEGSWSNLEIAKENLNSIAEHYKMHQDINNNYRSKKSKYQWFEENKNKSWFVNKPKLFCISSNNAIDEKDKKRVGKDNWEYRPDDYYAEYCLKLKCDNGEYMQISAFWCGYFEALYSAEIVIDNKGMKITF